MCPPRCSATGREALVTWGASSDFALAAGLLYWLRAGAGVGVGSRQFWSGGMVTALTATGTVAIDGSFFALSPGSRRFEGKADHMGATCVFGASGSFLR